MAFFAWSDLYNGGKTQEVTRPGGAPRTVVTERNIVPRGDKVTQKGLGVTDEEWKALLDGGSVREYEVPKDASDTVSPTRAILARVMNPQGDLDPDRLLELGLSNPPVLNLPSEEAEELPEGA